MNSGIYAITNTHSGKVYVGQSINIYARWRSHLYKLRRNRHSNPHLQAAFNTHGPSALVFSILEACPPRSLTEREAFHITRLNTLSPAHGYNFRTAESAPISSAASRFAMQRAQSLRRARPIPDTKETPDLPSQNH